VIYSPENIHSGRQSTFPQHLEHNDRIMCAHILTCQAIRVTNHIRHQVLVH